MIRAILFDLFDSLVYFPPVGVREEGIRLAGEAGLSEEQWISGWRSTGLAAACGEIKSLEERVRLSLIAAGLAEPAEDLVNALARSRLRQPASALLYPDVKECLTELRQQGLRLALISNIYDYEIGMLERMELDKLLDVLVLSCCERVCKPDPAIYLAATGKLSVAPGECAFIGDGLSNELAGARAVGITAVRIRRDEQSDDDERDSCFDIQVKDLPEFMSWLKSKQSSVE